MKNSSRSVLSKQDLLALRGQFGNAIRKLRRGKDFTQADLGEKSGLHRTYIADVERGARNPSLITVATLANALGLKVSELFEIAEDGQDPARKRWNSGS
jgi:transcriptional regulator with XRE-family HTH domain